MNTRKDEKAQFYRKKVIVLPNTTRETSKREFIYTESKFMGGGLFVNARQMTNQEVVNSGLEYTKETVKFTVNRNPLILDDLKVIYRGEVYDIQSVDELDFRTNEISFVAIKSIDTTNYSGDIFNE